MDSDSDNDRIESIQKEGNQKADAPAPTMPLASSESIYRSIIHFTVNKVELKLTSPWKTGSPKESTGTGFYIGRLS